MLAWIYVDRTIYNTNLLDVAYIRARMTFQPLDQETTSRPKLATFLYSTTLLL